ncbi:hypothetical protein V1264_010099 [Littorina saxatilis]|uniref:Uncharacterized protein n=1 Tax=Littorina saxatilis TaxID=31220 RepID=A0AAN9ANV4_9CAEN
MGRRCGRGRRQHDLDLADLELRESRSLLTYLTRLLFVTIVLSCCVIFCVSLLLLVQCRHAVTPMEGLVEESHGQCSTLGIPAYYTCLVLLIAVFGFGCVGRRVSGLLLVAVSVVAMVIAVVVVVTQDCSQDVSAVLDSLVAKLAHCGLYSSATNRTSVAWMYPAQFQRFDFLSDSSVLAACRDTAVGFNSLCGQHIDVHITMSQRHKINHTGLQLCARNMTDTLHALCMQDSEVGFPILLSAPVFFIVIGAGLVYIKHKEERRRLKAGVSISSVGTSTERGAASSHPSSGRHVLSAWLTSLCTANSLCFTCLLRGNQCPCCSSLSPSTTTTIVNHASPSRVSFNLTEMGRNDDDNEQEEVEVEQGGEREVRTSRRHRMPKSRSKSRSLSHTDEELHLIDDFV